MHEDTFMEDAITISQPYHYTDCGLDNIWLAGGVSHEETPYGPATAIHDIDGLHRAIGLSIINSRKITGAEFRFLREELDLSQRVLGGLIRANEQQIHRWENGKVNIPGPAQAMLAAYYYEVTVEGGKLKDLLERIAELDADLMARESRTFTVSDGGWEPQAA